MKHFEEDKKRRKYKRTESSICRAYVSHNQTTWREVEIGDVSAGGIRIIAEKGRVKEDKDIFIKIDVMSGFSEFVFKTKVKIIRKEEKENKDIFAMEFTDLSKINQIMLDEILTSENMKYAHLI